MLICGGRIKSRNFKVVMFNRICYIILGLLVVGNVVLTYRNMQKVHRLEVRNVLPKNENKELIDPKEVRQYVLEMARREKLNVAMVDHIGYCESRWRYDAVSRTGKYKGVFQISDIHQLGDDRLDVVKSTKWSLDKMKREGFNAWECSKI